MPQTVYKLFESVLTRCLSLWVKPTVLPDDPTTLINPDIPVLYVLEVGGLADRAALKLACNRFKLPDPSAALSYGTVAESASVVVLKHRRGFAFRRHRYVMSPRLERVVNAAMPIEAGELQIVPVAVYWGRAPDKDSSFWRLLFIENWQLAGRTRKLFTTLLHGRHTLLSISEPLSVRTLMRTDSSPAILQRKLSRILRVHFRQRRIASLGPDQSHRRMLVSHVIADDGVRAAVAAQAAQDNRHPDRYRLLAERYALEIAADVSYPTVRMLHRLFTRVWTGLYDGVQLDGIERLKAVADGREIVYVPCHRSHIDYMLLSYILYDQGYSLPHVAAGINLKLPIIGGIIRRGGGFFLRRTFAGNKLYAATFNAYLKEILQRGHALEYFIEGGRSRTGRLLPPKSGMLAMTVHAYLRNPRTPVVFVPIYFGYERLLEGRAFTSELAGGKKQKESVFGFLKALRTLREEYGHVYVNFGEPIALNTLVEAHHPGWRDELVGTSRPDWLTPVISELGTSIMQHMNQAASVTPISLLATAILATPRDSLSRKELLQQVSVYHQLLQAAHAGTAVVVPATVPEDIVEHGVKLGFVQIVKDPIGELVVVRPRQAAPLTYFRNNILHLLILPSLIACCFTNSAYRSREKVQRMVLLSYPILQAELFLAENATLNELDQALQGLATCGLLEPSDDGWRRASAGSFEAVSLTRLAQSVMPTLERYYICAALLARAPTEGIARETLGEQNRACAERLAVTHGRHAGDLYDKHLFNTLMDTLIDKGLVHNADDRLTVTEALLKTEIDGRNMLGEQIRHAILNTTLAFRPAAEKLPESLPG